jgi:hypothetical protein
LGNRAALGISTGISALLFFQPFLPTLFGFLQGAFLLLAIGTGGYDLVLQFVLRRFWRLAPITG